MSSVKRFAKAVYAGLASGNAYGKLVILISLIIAIPLIMLPFYPEDAVYAGSFIAPSLASLAAGLVVCALTKASEEPSQEWRSPLQAGSLPVLFAWCYAFALGAAPFVIGGQLSPILAMFESISGWTTTGLTVVEVAKMPHIFLFHRSFMQYCGGLGFVIMIAMLIKGRQPMNLYSAEGHPDRLMPNLRRTSRAISGLYFCFLIGGVVLYCIFGMGLFDAICHTMSALSTAGYSTQTLSIGAYQSLSIEIVTILLMLIGASNFAALWLLAEGKIKRICRVSEMRFMMALTAVFTVIVAIALAAGMGMGVGESVRQSIFSVVSVFSTTGYSTMDYAVWPPITLGLFVILMIVGGGAGSTAGGIKLSRSYLLLRVTKKIISKKLHPMRKVKLDTYNTVRGDEQITDALALDVFGFVACYMGVFMLGSLAVMATSGCSAFDAVFEFASALGNIGISNGVSSANADAGTLIIQMVGMALGRLEILIVFIGLFSAARAVKRGIDKLRNRTSKNIVQNADSE